MIPKNVQKLIDTYKASQLRLIDMIAKAEAKGNVTAYRRAVLADVKQELSSLDKFARKWASEEIPLSYKEGMNEALDAIKKTDIDITKVMTSKKAIKILTDSASDMLEEASMYVGRRINDLLKEAGEEAIAEKLSAGDTVKQAKNLMLKKMSDKGITAIRDKRGREISLDAYASMVARTTTREATNTGTIDAVQEVGGDLVQMTSHASACPICQPLEGRVYSISGKSKKYPKLDIAFSNGHPVIHPNCIHSIVPFFEQFADDLDEIVKQSNRPFELDPKKKSQLDAYYAEQKKKAQRRSDYKLWEKSKTLAPDEAPKTFSGFRSMKRANSPRYQELRAQMLTKKRIMNIPKTRAEVIESLKGKGIEIKGDIFKGVDAEVMEGNIRRLDEITDKYPGMKDSLTEKPITVETKVSTGQSIASVTTRSDSRTITYNKSYMQTKDMVIQNEERLQNTGWLTKTSKEAYTVATTNHEAGHLIQDALIKHIKDLNPEYYKLQVDAIKKANLYNPAKAVQKIKQIDKRLMEDINNEIINVARAANPGIRITKENLGSEYGLKNPFEWFAEAFSNAEGGTPNKIGRAMTEYLGGKL